MGRRRVPERAKKSLPSTAVCAIIGPPTIEPMTINLCERCGGYFGGTSLVVTSALNLRIMCPSQAVKAKSIEESNEPSIQQLRKRAFAITESRTQSGLSTDGRPTLPTSIVKSLVKLLRTLLPGPLFVCGVPATLKQLAAVETAAVEALSFAFSLEDTRWDRIEAEVRVRVFRTRSTVHVCHHTVLTLSLVLVHAPRPHRSGALQSRSNTARRSLQSSPHAQSA